MSNILVTGGSGLIGKFLLENINIHGKIVSLTRNIESNSSKNVISIKSDLDKISVNEISKIYEDYRISHIIHCAGIKKVASQSDFDFNKFTIEKFLIGDFEKKRQFIVLGSIAEYGIVNDGSISERTPCRPVGKYAISKYEQTLLCLKYFNQGYKVNVLRLTNPILPNLSDSTFIGALMKAIKNDEMLTINNPLIKRDFVDGRDLASFIERLVLTQFVPHPIVNFGTGISYTYDEIITQTNKFLGELHDRPYVKVNVANGEEMFSSVDVSTELLKRDFSYENQYKIGQSLEWMLEYTLT